jgi:predicted nucleic acid-binding protein
MGGRLYIDANILIYLVEGQDLRKTQAQDFLANHAANGGTLHSSEMIAGECLRGALSRGEAVTRAYSRLLFSGSFM